MLRAPSSCQTPVTPPPPKPWNQKTPLISQNHQYLQGNWLCIIDCSGIFYIQMKSDLKSEFG